MKYILLYVFGFLLLTSFKGHTVDDVVSALKNGSATQLSKFFDNTVDIALPDKANVYSRQQAELVIRDFFINNTVRSFEVIHKGDNSGSQFCIGSLETKNGTYRTTIYLKLKGDKEVLQELRFEK